MSSETRQYELKVRAERQEETRRRIAAATAELHEEVGPAKTTVAEIARRAGVSRLTVYNNFPDDYHLVAACQGHFLTEHPLPDPTPALAQENPAERLRGVLRAFYGWYRENETMAGNVRRDRAAVPGLDQLLAESSDVLLAHLTETLAAGFGRGSKRTRAAVALALDFHTWELLAREGLSDRAAADLMVEAVKCA